MRESGKMDISMVKESTKAKTAYGKKAVGRAARG